MPRPSNKEKLLADGLRLVHERGFWGVQRARHHSSSRRTSGVVHEPFRFEGSIWTRDPRALPSDDERCGESDATQRPATAPDRLRAWIGGQLSYLRKDDIRRGCLYGNLSAEASEASDAIRFRVASVFAENPASVAYCLEAAIEAGELAPKTDVQELAGFIVSSLQGAILVAKSQRSPIPVERFERVLFATCFPRAGRYRSDVAGAVLAEAIARRQAVSLTPGNTFVHIG
jgi:TetR/AcrR family transcriptional repressor of nem operon